MSTVKVETARKAARWWANHLRCTAELDNGDRSFTGFQTEILATMLQEAETKKGSPDDADKFEEALAKVLAGKNDQWLAIHVDYGPDILLSEAAKNAGVNLGMTRLPWKTCMWIEGEAITVSLGYQGERVQI